MRVLLRRPVFASLVAAIYFAATLIAAGTPLAACPALDTAGQPTHTHHDHGHHHHHGSGAKAGECLKCCLGACLLGVSLPPPASATASSPFYGARIFYLAEEVALADRSIPPNPAPPKPTA